MWLPHLDVGLIFRGIVTGERGLIIAEFNHDVSRPALAFDGF